MADFSVDMTAWQQEDADWERWQEAGSNALNSGDEGTAAKAFAKALRIARQHFKPGDPRLASSLASHGVMLSRKNDPLSKKLLAEAIDQWVKVDAWLAHQPLPKHARSSMFHLRLEAKHPGGYPDETKRICLLLAAEAREATEKLAEGATVANVALGQSWHPMSGKDFDVVRKVKTAVCLMAKG